MRARPHETRCLPTRMAAHADACIRIMSKYACLLCCSTLHWINTTTVTTALKKHCCKVDLTHELHHLTPQQIYGLHNLEQSAL